VTVSNVCTIRVPKLSSAGALGSLLFGTTGRVCHVGKWCPFSITFLGCDLFVFARAVCFAKIGRFMHRISSVSPASLERSARPCAMGRFNAIGCHICTVSLSKTPPRYSELLMRTPDVCDLQVYSCSETNFFSIFPYNPEHPLAYKLGEKKHTQIDRHFSA
jgi:hypothetical protein